MTLTGRAGVASNPRQPAWRTGMIVGAAGLFLAVAGPGRAMTAPEPPPNMTAKETDAHALWSLRAGLNVAGLQCQFSKSLRSVDNYNAFLRHHSDELADAVRTMTGYFRRTAGPKVADRRFDTYTTRLYQSFSTFDAQYSFCDQAAAITRRALQVPKGGASAFAKAEMVGLRVSLETPLPGVMTRTDMGWVTPPPLSNSCIVKPGRSRC
jgi:hypothetical protein